MAMTNLNYNHNDSNKSQPFQPSQPNPAKQCHASNSPNCHYTNYAAANLSHLSPIFEGEVFPSPSNTISPSLSHNNIDSNHVVLFHSNNLTPTNNNSDSKTPKTPNQDSVSPTTSISSSNSSNTPTPTAYNTSNSLFNIPSTNNNPPCIPSVGLMNANISKTSSTASSSSASASPSPSLDTTVSPVTKMDLFRDLKIFEDIDTDEHAEQFTNNNLTIDYLTGDKHCMKKHHVPQQTPPTPITPQSPLNHNSLHHKLSNNATKQPQQAKVEQMQLNEANASVSAEKEKQKTSTHESSRKKKKHRHRRHHHHHHHHSHHSHSHDSHHHHRERKKKKRRKSERNNCSDSDSELQKKGKIKDKIKTISIRVPGDPDGLYKYWKRTKHKHMVKMDAAAAAKHEHSASHSPLRCFAENKESRVTQQSILDYKLHKAKTTNKNRDRLNSYPPNNVTYSIKSPQTLSLSSPSSSNSTSNNHSIPPLIRTSQSCSNLLDKSIIIHAPNKENRDNNNKDSKHQHQCFSVLGLQHYQNKKRNDAYLKKGYGCNIMSGDPSPQNRVRMNSYPPYMDPHHEHAAHHKQHSLSISIERTNRKSSAAAHGIDDSKEYHEHDPDDWHYTKHRKQKQIHQQRMAAKNGMHPHHGTIHNGDSNASGVYYDNNPYLNPYYLTNYHDTKHMHSSLIYDYKWKEEDRVPTVPATTESLSEPNPSHYHHHLSHHEKDKSHTRHGHKRRRRIKNISDHHKDNRYNIHPSMNSKMKHHKHKMNSQSAKMTGNLVDL